jgi:hypothetical protein
MTLDTAMYNSQQYKHTALQYSCLCFTKPQLSNKIYIPNVVTYRNKTECSTAVLNLYKHPLKKINTVQICGGGNGFCFVIASFSSEN